MLTDLTNRISNKAFYCTAFTYTLTYT